MMSQMDPVTLLILAAALFVASVVMLVLVCAVADLVHVEIQQARVRRELRRAYGRKPTSLEVRRELVNRLHAWDKLHRKP
jgi:hypothetical protein